MDVPALVELAQSRVTRPFSEQECSRFRLESVLCPAPAAMSAPDQEEPEPATDPAEARAVLEEIAEAIAADDVSRALETFASDAFVGGWVLDTERVPDSARTPPGQMTDTDIRDTFRGGLEIAVARGTRMHGIECNQSVDGSVFCVYAVDGWVDPTRMLIMNLEIVMSEGRITRWLNWRPGGPGYDDFRAWMAFLHQQSDEDLHDCLDLALNDPSCVEVVALFLDEFRQTAD